MSILRIIFLSAIGLIILILSLYLHYSSTLYSDIQTQRNEYRKVIIFQRNELDKFKLLLDNKNEEVLAYNQYYFFLRDALAICQEELRELKE